MSILTRFARAAVLAGGLAALLAPASFAAPAPAPAGFIVVHGIPGRDVAPTLDPLLPVDVLVNGSLCLIKGLTFGQISGPFEVPAGTYTVEVSLANPITPCSNAAVITAQPKLAAGEFAAIVAALGTDGAPTADLFAANLSSVPAGQQRLMLAHAADAPEVWGHVLATGPGGQTYTVPLNPRTEKSLTIPAGPTFQVSIHLAGAPTSIGPVTVDPGNRGVALIFAVGSAKSGSATLLTKVLPDVF